MLTLGSDKIANACSEPLTIFSSYANNDIPAPSTQLLPRLNDKPIIMDETMYKVISLVKVT